MKKAIAIVVAFAMLALVAAVPAKAETAQTSDDDEQLGLVATNTDAEHLIKNVRAPQKVLIGKHSTRGLGAGAIPAVGESADEDTIVAWVSWVYTPNGKLPEQVREEIRNFIESKLSEIWDRLNSGEMVVYTSEDELKDIADTVIVIPNDKLLELVPRMPLNAAFRFADEILMRSIKSITEMMTRPGLINVDYADLKTI